MNKLQQSRIFLIAAILLIVAFQSYWLNKLYKEEWTGLQKETNTIFRDLVYNLQVERFKADTLFLRQKTGNNLFVYNAVNAFRSGLQKASEIKKDSGLQNGVTRAAAKTKYFFLRGNHADSNFSKAGKSVEIQDGPMSPELAAILREEHKRGLPAITDTSLIRQMTEGIGIKMVVNVKGNKHDSSNTSSSPRVQIFKDEEQPVITLSKKDSSFHKSTSKFDVKFDMMHPEKAIVRMITEGKALDDSISVGKLDSSYKKELIKAGIPLSFLIRTNKKDSLHKEEDSSAVAFRTDPVIVGFIHQYSYRAEFGTPSAYLLKKISPQILFSFFLVAFTSLAFIFLYRNLLAQRKLTTIKNDFISNVSHELKTPIATVNVAIEALRNFGGLDNPARTKEYLDISASELQRLSLLVDKVLKLSMFEKQEITLQKESFDFLQLIEEVIASMKLQFEKQKAAVSIESAGDNFMIDADKLHITSVVYNLLDNALKYSKGDPQINVKLIRHTEYFELRVSDNGIGIPAAYQSKIFEQFFRVPNGNRHNTKGYGLGLSYVNHIVKKHMGFIEVESEPGKGSTFIVKLPFAETDTIHFDKGRKISKKKFKLE